MDRTTTLYVFAFLHVMISYLLYTVHRNYSRLDALEDEDLPERVRDLERQIE